MAAQNACPFYLNDLKGLEVFTIEGNESGFACIFILLLPVQRISAL